MSSFVSNKAKQVAPLPETEAHKGLNPLSLLRLSSSSLHKAHAGFERSFATYFEISLTSPQVMSVAQKLYEGVETPNGHLALITYMRTDSVRI